MKNQLPINFLVKKYKTFQFNLSTVTLMKKQSPMPIIVSVDHNKQSH